MDSARFGTLLRSRREAKGWEMPEVARQVGLEPGVLGKYERGERQRPMDPDNVNALAVALENVSVLELVMAMGSAAELHQPAASHRTSEKAVLPGEGLHGLSEHGPL